MSPTRRQWLALGLLALAGGSLVLAHSARAAKAAAPRIEVWKDPQCGCCKDWIAHLQAQGFEVQVQPGDRQAARAALGLPDRYASCHTARVQGYVIEGHVPAADIHRLLRDRPQALGLAVPGMPVGSPGMDGPIYQGRKDPYDTVLVDLQGRGQVFQSHR